MPSAAGSEPPGRGSAQFLPSIDCGERVGVEHAGTLPYAGPMVQHCARCKRRNVVSYQVPEKIQRLVLLNRWKTGVCPSCFDELAEQGHIRYSFEDVSAV
jgi:hypothetical protein